MTAPKTRVARKGSRRTKALEPQLKPLVPEGDWYELAAKKSFMDFEADVVSAIVDGTVLR